MDSAAGGGLWEHRPERGHQPSLPGGAPSCSVVAQVYVMAKFTEQILRRFEVFFKRDLLVCLAGFRLKVCFPLFLIN